MAKRRREQTLQPEAEAEAQKQPGISKRGWMTIGAGCAVVLAGFYVLSLVDKDGRNWAAAVSPALILAGYITMGFGILVAEPAKT